MGANFENMLMYSTIKIETSNSISKGSGTGFFFSFECTNKTGNFINCIITNNHVVNESDDINLKFHLADKDARPTIHNIEVPLKKGEWVCIRHPNEKVDLCAIMIGSIIDSNRQKGQFLHAPSLVTALIPTSERLQRLNPINEILMIGYPIGLSDCVNNFPISRRGITATHPGLNYNGKAEFVIDAACWPGSSGSPVFNYGLTQSDSNGNIYIGSPRLELLGILYGGPSYDAGGKVISKEIPTNTLPLMHTSIPVNLGFVIKAQEIFNLEKEVQKYYLTQVGNEN